VVCSTSEYPHAITHVNEAWTALCGFTPEEALGKTCGLLQGPRTAESAKEAIASAVATSQRLSIEVVNYKKSGACFMNHLMLEPLANGRSVTHYMATLCENKEEAQLYAEAAHAQAAVGAKRSRTCRDAAEALARQGEFSLVDLLLAVASFLSPAKASVLLQLVDRMAQVGPHRHLDTGRFHACLLALLGDEAPQLAYFNDALHHFGTACYSDEAQIL
jgi:hypothetical protein